MRFCKWLSITTILATWIGPAAGADFRINHEGRVLGPVIPVTQPILFNTPEADAVLSSLQIFPRDNPWNEDISRRPLLTNSDAMIGQIIADLSSSRRTLRLFFEMNFVLVPDDQPLVPVDFFNYADESDPPPYPFPPNLPVETWPRETGALTLGDWQRDIEDAGGDRHAIAVMPGRGLLWETWLTRLTANGWEASNGAKFDLKSNALRPAGWTSGDAAGLPMFPALVRFDECERGMVEHAVRLVVKLTRVGPIYPATHQASVGNLKDRNIPAMGQRLRLKSDFVIPANWSQHEQAVLKGLKKYGAIVADNGGFFSISVTPDSRWAENEFSHLSSISITNFEVIQTTGPAEGPRSPGAAKASAGADLEAGVNRAVALTGSVQYTNTAPLQCLWREESGPGAVHFAYPTATNTTATFDTPGEYVMVLRADDGIHTPDYSALAVNVEENLPDTPSLTAAEHGREILLTWSGTTGHVIIESSTAGLSNPNWQILSVGGMDGNSILLPATQNQQFFRLRME
jgi:hypothetical protein